jgi:hypothetical protein
MLILLMDKYFLPIPNYRHAGKDYFVTSNSQTPTFKASAILNKVAMVG